MSTKIAIAELTRNYPGTDLDVLNRLTKLGPMFGVGHGQLLIVARPNQGYARQQAPAHLRWVEAAEGGAVVVVGNLLTELAARTDEIEVVIVSYSGDVLRLAQQYWGNLRVNALSLRNLRDTAALAGSSASSHDAPVWQFDNIIPLAEAKAILTKALSSGRPVRKTDLRPVLAAHDVRFAKQLNEPPGLISALLAASQDVVEFAGEWPNPTVSLKPQEVAEVARPTAASVVAATSEAKPEPAAAPEKKFRSREMGAYLTANGLGPFADARLQFYEALRELEKEELGDMTFADFLQEAADMAKDKVKVGNQPWPRILQFMSNSLTQVEAVLGESERPLQPGIGDMFETVHGLHKDLETRVDALILGKLAEQFEVSSRTIEDCARALYHSASQENRKRIALAYRHLVDSKRFVQVTENGTVVLRPAAAGTPHLDGSAPPLRLTGTTGDGV